MKKSIKIILFLIFTIIWSIIVYLFNGEWLHFIPLLVADVLFFETINWQFWKKKEKKEKKKKKKVKRKKEKKKKRKKEKKKKRKINYFSAFIYYNFYIEKELIYSL